MAKIFSYTQWDKIFCEAAEQAEDAGKLAASGATITSKRFKKSQEIACLPTIPIRDLTEENVRTAAENAVVAIAKQIKWCGVKCTSPIRIVPAHEPAKLRAGWSVFVDFEIEEDKVDNKDRGFGPVAHTTSKHGAVPVSIGPFGKSKR